MYNDNKYFCYTRQCIMTINIFVIHENIYCHYTRRCIMTINIFVIHENVFLIIQDDV